MTDSINLVCPHCSAINHIAPQRLEDHPICGKCKSKLFSGKPQDLNKNRFDRNLANNDIPLVVDFWASWCGPCKVMLPAFEQAAEELEPHARLVRLNTELEQEIAGRYTVRAIPTMILFKDGKQVQRQSGAMNARQIIDWVQQAT